MRKPTIRLYSFKKAGVTETYEIKMNRGTNKVQTPDQTSLGTEIFYRSPSMPKVSRNLALFANLKEELWFSVSITILNRYHFFVCNGTFSKAKLRQFRGDILRPRLVDLFYSKTNTALGDEAKEQTIPAQEQDWESQKIFCNSFFCL